MTTNHHTPIGDGAAATGANLSAPLSELDTVLTNLLTGAQAFTQFNLGAAAAKTIASDAIAVTTSRVKLAPETSTSDNLATITGGADGDILVLEVANVAHSIVLKNGTGNVYLSGGADITITSYKKVKLMWDGVNNKWCDLV